MRLTHHRENQEIKLAEYYTVNHVNAAFFTWNIYCIIVWEVRDPFVVRRQSRRRVASGLDYVSIFLVVI